MFAAALDVPLVDESLSVAREGRFRFRVPVAGISDTRKRQGQ
jgi:hypothetical protein